MTKQPLCAISSFKLHGNANCIHSDDVCVCAHVCASLFVSRLCHRRCVCVVCACARVSTYRFADPVYFGDYPSSMRQLVGARLPTFTDSERAMLHNSTTFFALNHYTSSYVSNVRVSTSPHTRRRVVTDADWNSDQRTYVSKVNSVTQQAIGIPADSS